MVIPTAAVEADSGSVVTHTWQVGEWLVEPHANRLVRGDDSIVLVPKVMQVLCVLIEHAGQAVADDVFMEQVWADAVVSDASLYQAISQLRKALGDTGKPRRYIQRVSAKGYVLTAAVSKQPEPAHEDNSPHNGSLSSRVTRSILGLRLPHRYAMAAVVLAVGAWITISILNRSWNSGDSAPLGAVERVAVLPFQLLGSDDEPYWLNGFADTLISRLASRQDLQVVYGNTSDVEMADAERLIGELDVDALLLGTVQQDQNKLRINIRIVNDSSAHTAHAEVIDGDVDHLFALQDSVALRLLHVLRPMDSDALEAPQKLDETAWQHYLLGRYHWSKRKSANLDLAIDYFQRVLAVEPDFALGYVGLCDSYHFQYLYADWSLEKVLSLCQPLLDKALALDAELGQVHASLGLLAQSQERSEKARHHLQRATELAPNYAPGWMWYGRFLRRQGDIGQALEHHRTALKLDPLSPIATRNLAFSLLASGVVNQARNTYARALELEPNYTNRPLEEIEFLPLTVDRAAAYLNWSEQFDDRYLSTTVNRLVKTQILLSLGKADAAQQELAGVPDDFHRHPYFLYTRGLVDLANGEHEVALEGFTRRMNIESLNRQRVMPTVGVLQHLGRQQQALALFLESYPEFENIDDMTISADNVWLFGILTYITDPDSAEAPTLRRKIATYIDTAAEESWLTVWLLGMIGELDVASNQLIRILEDGWLPNHQELLLPIEEDPAFAALISHNEGERIVRLLAKNRQLVLDQYDDARKTE